MSDGGEEFRLGDRQRVWGRDSGGDIGAFVSSLIYVARESNDTTGGSQKDMRSDRVNLCATDITALSTCPQKHTHTYIQQWIAGGSGTVSADTDCNHPWCIYLRKRSLRSNKELINY